MSTIVMISGSLRHASLNSALIRAAARAAESVPGIDSVKVLGIGTVPHFDSDVEAAGDPPTVAALKAEVYRARGLLIATPEYNGQPPGVLKNALDWLSRPVGAAPLTDLPVATVSASPGQYGAVWSQERLRELLASCGASVVEHDILAAAHAHRLFDEHGELADETARQHLTAVVTRLAEAAMAAAAA